MAVVEGSAKGDACPAPSKVGDDPQENGKEGEGVTETGKGEGEGEGQVLGAGLAPLVRGAYAQREEYLSSVEQKGDICFEGISSDSFKPGDVNTLRMLLAACNIYSKQLPNMPKEYIVKLVMDPTHRTVVVRKGNAVVGGLTYRSFPKQGFGEISFCAVLAVQQVKGYGTRLMNHAKEYAKRTERLTHFLTYADNNAVGYFLKQGFTIEITNPRDKWFGYIKDYDGGTLMECIIYDDFSYTDFPKIIKRQREEVDKVVRSLSKAHVVYPGINRTDSSPLKISEIPGLQEAGWLEDIPQYQVRVRNVYVDPSPANLYDFMKDVLENVRRHQDAWPFLDPVDPNAVPDYYDVVKDPIDLSAIEKLVEQRNYYLTLEIFAADVKRMFNSCKTYNAKETPYYKCAERLESFFEACISNNILRR